MPTPIPTFAAIDFETADYGRDSACAVAIVKVQESEIVSRWHRLIRPPRQRILFTRIHGISWLHVSDKPCFKELWPEMCEHLAGIQFLAAHNAGFDRAIMNGCCTMAGVEPPKLPFKCTVQLARKTWKLYPTKLPNVCRFLNIDLIHHQADSDAEACARIAIEAMKVEQAARERLLERGGAGGDLFGSRRL